MAPTDEAQLDAPLIVKAFPRAIALRCGAEASCVLDRAGVIHCIGGGQRSVRVLSGRAPARDFIVTGYSICALDGGGHVVCWDGPDGTPPTEVAAAAGATDFAIAAPDASRVCVARGDRPPVCFDAQLWEPMTTGPRLAVRNATSLDDLAGARALLVTGRSGETVCALSPSREITCRHPGAGAAPLGWASGVGATASGFAAAHGDIACVRVVAGETDRRPGPGAAGAVRCFGESTSPLARAIPTGALELALSAGHACALVDRDVRCWGHASRGQIGSGARYLHPAPIRVPGIAGATPLAAGQRRACAVRGGGTIACWGRREDGEDFAPSDLPGPAPAAPPVLEVVPGRGVGPLCARWRAGWWCHNGSIWFPRPPALATADRHFRVAGLRMRQIASDDACGVDPSGRLICAGCTRGDCTRAGARAALTSFDRGERGTRFVRATALYDHGPQRFVCGLTDAGGVRCFHADRAPLERVAAPGPIAEPTIDALADVVEIAATAGGTGGRDQGDGADGFACALGRDGAVHCWGGGRFGQLGTEPVAWRGAAARVEGLPPAVEIALGASFACALTTEGQVYCWGSNREGAAPDGSLADEPRPVRASLPW